MNDYPVYLISGMGLDERLFFKMNFQARRIHHIEWIEPLPRESIEDYARRLMEQIHDRGDLILVGVSFGGMMAIEIAKLLRVEQVIIISSIKQKSELPFLLKIGKFFPIYYLTTPGIRTTFRKLWGNFFGLLNDEAFEFFDDMFEKFSPRYKTWATNKISNWENETYPKNLVHIHGTKDLIFPAKKIENAIWVEGGSHGMIVNKAEIVSKHVNDAIQNLRTNAS